MKELKVMKEPQQVATKNPKKVEADKKLAEHNCRKREEKKREELKAQAQEQSGVNQHYGIGAILAVGVIGALGYYIYRTKKGERPSHLQQNHPLNQPPQSNKFEMD